MQTRSSYTRESCLSVRLFVCQTRGLYDKTEETAVQIFIPYERSLSLVFSEEERLVEATPFTWNFGSTGPRLSEIADFQSIIIFFIIIPA